MLILLYVGAAGLLAGLVVLSLSSLSPGLRLAGPASPVRVRELGPLRPAPVPVPDRSPDPVPSPVPGSVVESPDSVEDAPPVVPVVVAPGPVSAVVSVVDVDQVGSASYLARPSHIAAFGASVLAVPVFAWSGWVVAGLPGLSVAVVVAAVAGCGAATITAGGL